MRTILQTYLILTTLLIPVSLQAGVGNNVVREGIEWVGGKLARETIEEGIEAAARKTLQEGSEALIRKGTREVAAEALEAAAKKAGRAAVQYSDDAAKAVIKHGSVVAPLVERYGDDAARALTNVSSQNARRLAMIEEELVKSGQAEPVLRLIGQQGDEVVEWLWKHKTKLAAGVAAAVLVTNPEAVLNAGSNLVVGSLNAVGDHVVEPVTTGIFGILQIVICWGLLLVIGGGALLYCCPDLRQRAAQTARLTVKAWKLNKLLHRK